MASGAQLEIRSSLTVFDLIRPPKGNFFFPCIIFICVSGPPARAGRKALLSLKGTSTL